MPIRDEHRRTEQSRNWGWLGILALITLTATDARLTRAASVEGGRTGRTIYVSKSGDNSDGSSWAKAFHSIQAGLQAVPDDQGGHRVIVRPDTYAEANIHPSYKGAPGAYNVLMGDADGKLGSGATGWVVIDSGAPEVIVRTDHSIKGGNPPWKLMDTGDPKAEWGLKSVDWWGVFKSTPTFSSEICDRWIFRNMYMCGSEGSGWDLTCKKGAPFSVIMEDCVGVGRFAGIMVGAHVGRPDEPIVFRRNYFMCMDWWGDAAGAYVRAENPSPHDYPDAVFEDCTLVGPDNALQAGNPGFDGYTRVRIKNCRLISLNFSQPHGQPSTGVIYSTIKGKFLHVDIEDSVLMGYKIFGAGGKQYGAGENPDGGPISYTLKGKVQAYVHYLQPVPEGMERLRFWPVDAFQRLLPPGPPKGTGTAVPVAASGRPELGDETLVQKNMCEVSPVIWKGRHCLLACVRPATGGTREDYHLTIRDAETEVEMARFGAGHSLACAFVKDDTFYAFASRFENDNWNDVTLFKSQDLKAWEQKVVLKQEASEHLFNSSVCAGPNGFVMAYESNDPKYPAFTVKFACSNDLDTWTTIPEAVFGTDRYTACPAIRFVDGFYYLLYLEHRTPRWFFETCVARSTDLKKWFQSTLNPVLTPNSLDDGINASDPDLVEFGGRTHLYYAVGDQRTWMNTKRRTYPGPMAEFFKRWFPTEGVREPGDLDGYRARVDAQTKPKRLAWLNDGRFGLYIHLEKHPGATMQLPGLQNSIRKAWFLKNGTGLILDNKAKTLALPESLPDTAVTTIVLELDGSPSVQ